MYAFCNNIKEEMYTLGGMMNILFVNAWSLPLYLVVCNALKIQWARTVRQNMAGNGKYCPLLHTIIQQDAAVRSQIYFNAASLYMFRVLSTPIIRGLLTVSTCTGGCRYSLCTPDDWCGSTL